MREKKIMDGNMAAAYVSYAYSDICAIYPITPSSPMAEHIDILSSGGEKNIYGNVVEVSEMQSEAGAAGALHGALAAGAIATTFTSSQGLLLMLPNIYKIAGERLPAVFNVAARAVSVHALSIFGDHSDIYACRQTGAAIFMSSSVCQVSDLTPVSYMASVEAQIPFLNCFDGFRTSHEMQKVECYDYEQLKKLIDMKAVQAFKNNSLNPERACMMGSAQNPDVFFQFRETINEDYKKMPAIVKTCINRINDLTGKKYGLFDYYGDESAKKVIIAMGSVCEVARIAIDKLAEEGKKMGLVEVHLYRPFSVTDLIDAIPDTVEKIYVLDRTKEAGSSGEPLYLDVTAALYDSQFKNVPVFHGRYGLSSKDTSPAQIIAVYDNDTKKEFTIGIRDDVTNLSLDIPESYSGLADENSYTCRFYGLGGDGTVSANKNAVKIIGKHTDRYVQAYFDYDSKKSGGLTVSHLRFSDRQIRSTCLVNKADFVSCQNQTYLAKYDMISDIKKGGTFLINCSHDDKWINNSIPFKQRMHILKNDIKVYAIDGLEIGRRTGLNSKISTILQCAFFKVTGIIPIEEAVKYMKEAAKASYGQKGEKIVRMNNDAIELAAEGVRKVTITENKQRELSDVTDMQSFDITDMQSSDTTNNPLSEINDNKNDRNIRTFPDIKSNTSLDYYVNVIEKEVLRCKGNDLPVSAFMNFSNGALPSGSTAYERRNVAVTVPEWIKENCIQCNRCSFVCPHSVIRPAVLNDEDVRRMPSGMEAGDMTGLPGHKFSIVISYADCTGCGSCAAVCPGMKGKKALTMVATGNHEEKQEYFDFAKGLSEKEYVYEKFADNTVKGSQFRKPYMEFSGACAGCGETPYVKLLTQLFGRRMFIANATGCSSIWANSFPSTAYTIDENGYGPAWSSSLFEDGAEFGFGMYTGYEAVRRSLIEKIIQLYNECGEKKLSDVCRKWCDSYDDACENEKDTNSLINELVRIDSSFENESVSGKTKMMAEEILRLREYLTKKSFWVIGGDGFAYDIGFGGLDHVLASGRNINILVLDTECYSNTGGQASKATPYGASVKFMAEGKKLPKKDLAGMAMTYGYVYVASVAMGADFNQTIKVFKEAESYQGPSLIIAYATCIAHGIRAGLGSSMHEEEKAVRCGHVKLFHYDPRDKKDGNDGYHDDTKKVNMDKNEFYQGEIRFVNMSEAGENKQE